MLQRKAQKGQDIEEKAKLDILKRSANKLEEKTGNPTLDYQVDSNGTSAAALKAEGDGAYFHAREDDVPMRGIKIVGEGEGGTLFERLRGLPMFRNVKLRNGADWILIRNGRQIPGQTKTVTDLNDVGRQVDGGINQTIGLTAKGNLLRDQKHSAELVDYPTSGPEAILDIEIREKDRQEKSMREIADTIYDEVERKMKETDFRTSPYYGLMDDIQLTVAVRPTGKNPDPKDVYTRAFKLPMGKQRQEIQKITHI
jgi:hypothetical protein